MFIKPMLAASREEAFDSKEFLFEPKSNGVRLELISGDDGIKLFTRHGNDITSSLPEITTLEIDKGIILDGELVCYDAENPLQEDFEGVMSRITSKKQIKVGFAAKQNPCTMIVFDILHNKNKSIMDLPLLERKMILDKAVENQPALKKGIYVQETGIKLFEIIKQYNLEGTLSKRLDSRYQAGKRPKDVWYKIINWHYSECVITGYRKDSVGWYLSNEEGKGFVEFGISPKQKKDFYKLAEKLKTGENENSVWIQPVIKCKVKHRGFLRSGNMMTPVFVEFIN